MEYYNIPFEISSVSKVIQSTFRCKKKHHIVVIFSWHEEMCRRLLADDPCLHRYRQTHPVGAHRSWMNGQCNRSIRRTLKLNHEFPIQQSIDCQDFTTFARFRMGLFLLATEISSAYGQDRPRRWAACFHSG